MSDLQTWQPIDTAPKDKAVMLCVEGWQPCCGRWWPVDECWVSFDWDGHFESDKEMSEYVGNTTYEPTHWMPLPQGPNTRPVLAKPGLVGSPPDERGEA